MGTPESAKDAAPSPAMEGGSYEVIRARLRERAAELGRKADELNARRRQLFGGQELAIAGNLRVRTENNCVPRDIVAIGTHLLFGFNVFIGLKKETAIADVFALHSLEKAAEGFELPASGLDSCGGCFRDGRLAKDFAELYRYYKDSRLLQFRRTESRLLAIFQAGVTARDTKVLRFSLDPEGNGTYIDNRGEGDWVRPASHDFEWTLATRERFVLGRHPHVNILDEVFVETVKGDLTVKVENNTEDGLGIYREPVEDPDQSLDDAEIHFAKVGVLILLKVLPFREEAYRTLVFNTRTKHVVRIDPIGQACVQLPEDQGVIFPGGYYLQTGDYKVFEGPTAGLEYERAVRSPNGEDVLYVFHERDQGKYVLLPYNLVRKEVQNPILCHGYSLFADGKMVVFRAGEETTRVHPMQVWQTPFVSAEFAAATPPPASFLGKVGNADLVRGISDAYTLKRMVEGVRPTRRTYEDLVSYATRTADAYHWLGHQEVGLLQLVEELRKTAELIIDEFEKVQALTRRAEEAIASAAAEQERLAASLSPEQLSSVDAYLGALTALRKQRGHLITLKEVRYVDLQKLEKLEADAAAAFERASAACVEFLLRPDSLKPLAERMDAVLAKLAPVTRTSEIAPIQEDLEQTSQGLDLVAEVVGGLQVGDPADRARILEGISDVFARLNRVRATVVGRRKELLRRERRAEFGAQFKLLSQSIESALAVCDAPEKCDEQLSRLQVQLEEMEGHFSELDDFLGQLADKREELLEAFGAKKQALLDERQRRAQNLFGAAERILQGVSRRTKGFSSEDELNAYFAADPMVQKLRALAGQLLSLGDSVKADEVESRLKAARQDALRSLRDRLDLFEEGAQVIKLGPFRFNVNAQPLELTVVPRDGALWLHLSGTDFQLRLEDPELEKAKGLWEQTLVSESPEVYRGEHLAASILFAAEEGREGLSLGRLQEAARSGDGLLALVRSFAAERYDEGYDRGLHDADAAAILEKLLSLREGAGLLRYAPTPRAWGCLFWSELADEAARASFAHRARSLRRLRESFSQSAEAAALGAELGERIDSFLATAGLEHSGSDALLAGRYLAEELSGEHPRFVTSAGASALRAGLWSALELSGARAALEEDLRAISGPKALSERFRLVRAWLTAFAESKAAASAHRDALDEAAVLVLADERRLDRGVATALTSGEVQGLLGQHPRIAGGGLTVRLDEMVARLTEFATVRVPAFRAYRERIREVVERERGKLRLEELSPKVLSTFVRNRLIDEVYLPVIGANLAKQLGAAGEGKRTDRMGLLLLISPPGYGKTTLMEYVASRLGLAFVKVNGPALGHEVRSLDPAEAPNATARQEVERINLSFELGNNVMLYLDDIQHTHSELLQKFISLCDAQRRVEGVYGGRTRTYDFRGKKFCVVMAGNPYTESGERFRIPDMLANRADTYNLGDILAGKEELFALSYLENALTSNPTLAPLATRPASDVHKLVRMAKGEEVNASELSHGYSAVEIQELTAVFQRLFHLQEVLLKVNQQYIASASQDERFRSEPAFKLQGSYRNMNKLAEKVVAAMNEEELERLIDDHYQREAQTLTTSAEHNLLKLAELRGRMTPEQQARWQEIKKGYRRVQAMGGKDDDPAVRVTGQLATLGVELSSLREAVEAAASRPAEDPATLKLLPKLDGLREAVLRSAEAAQARPSGANELSPRLEALVGAVRELSQSSRASGAELAPQLEALRAAVLEVAKASSPPAIPPGLSYKQRAAASLPEEVGKQLQLVQEMLAPLAKEARRTLQTGGDGHLDAMQVWKQVNEAIELIKAMGVRQVRRPPPGRPPG
ncbi:MAG: DNA repair ATPase [Myxococcales bacterium]|nr:DNA repair ATPase [Myxococcales bacterium]